MRIINYNKIRFFDVTLRDGLQSMQKIYTLDEKKSLLDKILLKYPNTKEIEIGSLVSSKILPQMSDSLEFYKYAEKKYPEYNFYMLIPNKNKFKLAKENNIKNLSFITSASDSFQKKNVNKTITDTNSELWKITNEIDDTYKTKLYISCINECPLAGKIDFENLMYKINNNLHFKIDNICLSDTCGTLTFNDFKYIIENINETKINKLSLHLHNSKNKDIIDIINYAIKNNITYFDVSDIDSGGCSVTMKPDMLTNNLSYDFFNKYS